MKTRLNIAFAILAGFFLSGFLLVQTLSQFVPLPESLSTSRSTSPLEGRQLSDAPDITFTSALTGKLQAELETYLSEHVPNREAPVFANAAIQRAIICLAGKAVGYNCYPSYYGSSVLYLDEVGAASVPKLYTDSETYIKNLSLFANNLKNVAAQFPSKRFIVCMAAGDNTPDISPASNLMSDYISAATISNVLETTFADCENITYVSDAGTYKSLDDYYQHYYKSDHHWNIKGVARCFNRIARELGFPTYSEESIQIVGTEPFEGSTARGGRCLISDPAADLDHDFSDITLEGNAEQDETGDEHAAFFGASSETQRYNYYGLYYSLSATWRGPGEKRAVLICDSFGQGIARLVAEQYQTLYCFNDAHNQAREGRLVERIAESRADDIWIVSNSLDLETFGSRNPGYFD